MLDEEKVAVASIKSNLFKNYKNVPEFIKNSLENEEIAPKIEETQEIEEKTPILSENEANLEENVQNNQSKEREIKAKLALIRNSLIIKNMKERGEDK